MNLPKFILFTFAGSLIWGISLTLLGYYIGDVWNKLVEGSGVFNIISIIVIVGILAVLAYHYYNKRHKISSSSTETTIELLYFQLGMFYFVTLA